MVFIFLYNNYRVQHAILRNCYILSTTYCVSVPQTSYLSYSTQPCKGSYYKSNWIKFTSQFPGIHRYQMYSSPLSHLLLAFIDVSLKREKRGVRVFVEGTGYWIQSYRLRNNTSTRRRYRGPHALCLRVSSFQAQASHFPIKPQSARHLIHTCSLLWGMSEPLSSFGFY